MDHKLWNAIQELLDIAESSAKTLDRFAGDTWDKWAGQMVPNEALICQTELEACVARVEKLMPAAPDDLPDMGALIGKAHREETL
jgi:hypothetical protein